MKGIMFKSWKIKAIADSSPEFEWQTRRLRGLKEINQEPDKWVWAGTTFEGYAFGNSETKQIITVKPPYQVGDIVYIKEVHRFSFAWEKTKTRDIPPSTRVYYKDSEADIPLGRWRSPMFMPEWAARDFAKITSVRPELLKLPLSPEDSIAEGGKRALEILNGQVGKWQFVYTVKEMRQELSKVTSSVAGTDRFIAQSLPLLIEEIQLIRNRLDNILYRLINNSGLPLPDNVIADDDVLIHMPSNKGDDVDFKVNILDNFARGTSLKGAVLEALAPFDNKIPKTLDKDSQELLQGILDIKEEVE